MLLYYGFSKFKRDLDLFSHNKLKTMYFRCIEIMNELGYFSANPELYSEFWAAEVLSTRYHDKICKLTVDLNCPIKTHHAPLRHIPRGSWYFDHTPGIRVVHKILLGKVRMQRFRGISRF